MLCFSLIKVFITIQCEYKLVFVIITDIYYFFNLTFSYKTVLQIFGEILYLRNSFL